MDHRVRHDVIVIGAGQAGLAVSRRLTALGVDHLVLERDRVGASWARLWESFRVNTPNWSARLPGQAYDGLAPDGFMSRAEIVTYLERYAAGAPVREGISVASLSRRDGGFELATSDGPLAARSVVVCTGAYQAPFRPTDAASGPIDVPVVDTRSYRDPSALPDGKVLVIGNGQSGCQIAEELLEAGRDVVISCGRAPWAPRRIGDHDLLWWTLETGFLDQTVDDLPSPAARLTATVTASGVDGGHDLHARTVRAKGAILVGRSLGAGEDGFRFADDLAESVAWADARYLDLVGDVETLCRERGIARPDLPRPEPFDPGAPTSIPSSGFGAIVSAAGFRPDYGWIDVEGAFDDMGFPVQRDGASAVAPGLFFAGVHFLRSRRSSLLCGIGDDAHVVARGVERHLATHTP